MVTFNITGTFVDTISHNASFSLIGDEQEATLLLSNFEGPGQYTITNMTGPGTWDGTA